MSLLELPSVKLHIKHLSEAVTAEDLSSTSKSRVWVTSPSNLQFSLFWLQGQILEVSLNSLDNIIQA